MVLDWHHNATRNITFHVRGQTFRKGVDLGFKEKEIFEVCENALKFADENLLGGKHFYLASDDHPTYADLTVFFDVTMLDWLKYDYSKFKHVDAWLKVLRETPFVKEANVEYEKIFNALKD